MIGWLQGILRVKQPPLLLLDVQGVGYEVEVPMTTFYDLPDSGEQVTLHTHHVVREDASLLYGFLKEQDRLLFRTLIKVNGVGPKMALTILSGMNALQFSQCVQNEDLGQLTSLPGVGKKTAERLIIEMRDKVKKMDSDTSLSHSEISNGSGDPVSEAISALIALGYKAADANKRVNSIAKEHDSCEELIRFALKSG